MQATIYLLTDYRGYFLSKNHADPPGSGMSIDLLKNFFNQSGSKVEVSTITKAAANIKDFEGKVVLYTSSEDKGGYYKSFVEDVIYALEQAGAILIPCFSFLKAHNNKVMQELLRQHLLNEVNPGSHVYGCIDECISDAQSGLFNYPVVFKAYDGAMSKNVALANNSEELIKVIKSHANADSLFFTIRDFLRRIRYKNLRTYSHYRKKFIIQHFIPDLQNDWKVLVFNDRHYIFERPVRKNDFRASGSGHDGYIYGSKVSVPAGIFDYAEQFRKAFDTPLLSLDICKGADGYVLIEYQFIHFGTVGQVRADGYYRKEPDTNKWDFIAEKIELERVYAEAIIKFIKEKKAASELT
jgi:glutathione synthase/RimK-type ligase-like ATP-grasp enzyme